MKIFGFFIRLVGYSISCFGVYIFVQQVYHWIQAKIWLALPLSLLFFGPDNESISPMVPFHLGMNIDQWNNFNSLLGYVPLTVFWVALGVVVSAQGVRLQERASNQSILNKADDIDH